jgi:nucleoside-diphosphate-sugar epimerase
LSLAKALAESGCKRLVAAGTCAEYDWDYGFLSEDITPLKPRTLYGICKNSTRQVLQAYCGGVAMDFAWTRFFYLFGPGEPKERLVPSVVLALLNGQTAKCTHGEQIRDFLCVEEVASAVWAVAQSDFSGPVNIGSGQPVKIRTLVEALGRILNKSGDIIFGALPTDPEEPPLLVADVRKLKAHTGWAPTWSLEDGLRQAVSWWQSNKGEQKTV